MPKCFLIALLVLNGASALLAQTDHLQASWFQRRIDWADRYTTLIPLNQRLAIAERNGYWGLVAHDGEEKTPFRFVQKWIDAQGLTLSDGVQSLRYDTAGNVWMSSPAETMVQLNDSGYQSIVDKDRFGLRNAAGQLVLPPVYTMIQVENGKILAADSIGQWGLYDARGKRLTPPEITYLSRLPHGFFSGRRAGDTRLALLDSTGKTLSAFRFTDIHPLCDGTFWASEQDRFQHYDNTGKPLSDPPCQQIRPAANGLAYRVQRQGRYLYWDACGKPILEEASWAYEDDPTHAYRVGSLLIPKPQNMPAEVLVFEQNKGYGAYLAAAQRTIPAEYRQFFFPPDRIIGCRSDGSTDWFDRQGRLLRHSSDSIAEAMANRRATDGHVASNLFLIKKDGRSGVLDSEGNRLVEPTYQWIELSGSGCFRGNDSKGRIRLLDPFGRPIVLPVGAYPEKVVGNWVLFNNDKHGGVADLSGRIRFEPSSDTWYPMPEGNYFYFEKNQLWGVMDNSGRVLLPAAYAQASDIFWANGHFFLTKNGLRGLADLSGRLLVPLEFSVCQNFRQFIFFRNGSRNVRFDPASGTLTDMSWEWMGNIGNDLIIAREKGRWGVLDKNLQTFLSFEYDAVSWEQSHLAAKRDGKTYWYRYEWGRLLPVPADRVLLHYGSITLIERGGKQGLLSRGADSLPVVYDRILMRPGNPDPLVLLRDGRCTVPAPEKDRPPRFDFEADSIQATPNLDWLQYWKDGQPWVLQLRSGARRSMQVIDPKNQYEYFDWSPQNNPPLERLEVHRIRINGRERYAILDSLLQDRAPEDLVFDTENYLHRPDGTILLRVIQNGKQGLWSLADKRLLVPCAYDKIEKVEQSTGIRQFNAGLPRWISRPAPVVLLQKNGQYGLGRLADGTELLPCRYDEIGTMVDTFGLLPFSDGGRYGLIRVRDEKILPAEYANRPYVDPASGLIELFRENGGHGLATPALDIIVPTVHEQVYSLNGLIIAQKNQLWGIYDRSGVLLRPFVFDHIEKTAFGKNFRVVQNGKEALLNSVLEPLTGFEYESIESKANPGGWLICSKTLPDSLRKNCDWDAYGLLDTLGRVALPPVFLDVSFCAAGILVKNPSNRLYGSLDLDLRERIAPIYDRLRSTRDGHLLAQKNGKWGVLNADSSVLIPIDFDVLEESAVEEPYIAGRNGRFALLGRDGRWVSGFDFEYAEGFASGRAAVRRGGQWGYIDPQGRALIPLEYQYADQFDGTRHLAWVMRNGKLFQVDTNGLVVTPQAGATPYISKVRLYRYGWNESPIPGLQDRYGRTIIANDSLAIFEPNGAICMYERVKPDGGPRWGLMDLSGRILTPRCFDRLYDNTCFNRGQYVVVPFERKGRWGYIDSLGKIVLAAELDKAEPFGDDGRAAVKKGGKTYWIDTSGRCVAGCR